MKSKADWVTKMDILLTYGTILKLSGNRILNYYNFLLAQIITTSCRHLYRNYNAYILSLNNYKGDFLVIKLLGLVISYKLEQLMINNNLFFLRVF